MEQCDTLQAAFGGEGKESQVGRLDITPGSLFSGTEVSINR